MYKFSNNELDVQGIKVFSSILIKGLKDGTLHIDDVFISKNVDTTSGSLKIFKDYLFFDKNGFACNFNLQERCLYETGKYIGFPNTLIENEFICSYNSNFENNIFNWDIGIYDFKSKVLLRKIDYLKNRNIVLRLDLNKLIVSSKNENIGKVSLLTNELEWETNLELYGQIRKILGVFKNKLWISLYRGGIDKKLKRLLALDINTGQVVYENPTDYNLSDCFIKLIPEQNSILSIYGKISSHSKADSPLVEINATTGEIKRNGRIESLYQENLKLGQWQYLNDKIYFTAAKDTINSTHIGVLDYKTLDLLWYTEVKDRKAGMKDLQVTEDKIYVLDQGNQLHIFEKEE